MLQQQPSYLGGKDSEQRRPCHRTPAIPIHLGRSWHHQVRGTPPGRVCQSFGPGRGAPALDSAPKRLEFPPGCALAGGVVGVAQECQQRDFQVGTGQAPTKHTDWTAAPTDRRAFSYSLKEWGPRNQPIRGPKSPNQPEEIGGAVPSRGQPAAESLSFPE